MFRSNNHLYAQAIDDLKGVTIASASSLEKELVNSKSAKKELAEIIQRVTGHQGEIVWDSSKPDGTPRKLLDVSKIKEIGWEYKTDLQQGIEKTYAWFLENIKVAKL